MDENYQKFVVEQQERVETLQVQGEDQLEQEESPEDAEEADRLASALESLGDL